MKSILLQILMSVSLMAACGTSEQNDKDGQIVTPAKADAFWEQVDSVATILMDSTKTADEICPVLERISDTMFSIVSTYDSFEFVMEVRGLGRYWTPMFMQDEREIPLSCWEKMLMAPYQWTAINSDSVSMLTTSLFRSSKEMWSRFATLSLCASNDLKKAVLVVTNYADTMIRDIRLSFVDESDKVFKVLSAEDGDIDVSDREDGIIRLFYELDQVIPALKRTSVLKLSYQAPDETVEMVQLMSFPDYPFTDKLKECPRLNIGE